MHTPILCYKICLEDSYFLTFINRFYFQERLVIIYQKNQLNLKPWEYAFEASMTMYRRDTHTQQCIGRWPVCSLSIDNSSVGVLRCQFVMLLCLWGLGFGIAFEKPIINSGIHPPCRDYGTILWLAISVPNSLPAIFSNLCLCLFFYPALIYKYFVWRW